MAILVTFSGSAGAFELSVQSATSPAGRVIDLPVRLRTGDTPISALVFEIEYDSSRLVFDPQTSKSEIPPEDKSGYATDLFSEAIERGRIGVSVYDPAAPITVLPDGNIVTLRFQVKTAAEGFAQVRVTGSPAPDAADAAGQRVVQWNPGDERTGIFIAASRARVSSVPTALSFGAVAAGQPVERDLILTNSGNAPASVQSISIDQEGGFTLRGTPALPFKVRENGVVSVPLLFRNDVVGRHSATVIVETADAIRLEIPVSATVVTEGGTAHEVRLLVPAAASLTGAGGSRWRSSLAMMNSSSAPVSVLVSLQSSESLRTREVVLDAGQSRQLADVVSELFGESERSGALILDSSSPDLVVRSTTENVNAQGGVLGQAVPVVDWQELFHTGQAAWLVALEQSADRQSNVALLNLSDSAIALKVTLVQNSEVIGDRIYILEPRQILQRIDAFVALGAEGENLAVEVEAVSPDALFFAYASTIDRRTGGPVFQSPR